MQEDQLIFLISQPRAGSTMLQAILSNNQQVDTTSEHWFMLNQAWFVKPKLVKGEFNAWAANDALNSISSRIHKDLLREEFKSFCLRFYQHILSNSGNYCLDKTPRYYEIIPELMELFPKSKFIILIRNPLDVLRSIMDTWKLYSFGALYEMRRDILLAPFKLARAMSDLNGHPSVKFVYYEKLIDNPSLIVKNLNDWLGIAFSDDMLNYSENQKHLGTYGDPVGVKENTHPSIRKGWNETTTGESFKDFFDGYAFYLKDCLAQLSYPEAGLNTPSNRVFGIFKYYCDSKWPERHILGKSTAFKKEMLLKSSYRKFLK
jgi:hypothetical protein